MDFNEKVYVDEQFLQECGFQREDKSDKFVINKKGGRVQFDTSNDELAIWSGLGETWDYAFFVTDVTKPKLLIILMALQMHGG